MKDFKQQRRLPPRNRHLQIGSLRKRTTAKATPKINDLLGLMMKNNRAACCGTHLNRIV